MVYAAPVEFARESGKCIMQGVMFEFPVIDGGFFGYQFYQGQVIQRQRQCFPAYKQGQLMIMLEKDGDEAEFEIGNKILFCPLVSPSGMVETPRLQAKNGLAICTRRVHELVFCLSLRERPPRSGG